MGQTIVYQLQKKAFIYFLKDTNEKNSLWRIIF
jgi:hypothetical protein